MRHNTCRGLIVTGVLGAAVAASAAVDLPNFDLSYGSSASPVRTAAAPIPGVVAAVDGRSGAPSLIWASPSAAELRHAGDSAELVARRTLRAFAPAYGLTAAAVDNVTVERVHDTGRGGILVVLRQEVDGIPIFGQRLSVLLTRELRPVALGGTLYASGVRTPATRAATTLDATEALALAFADLYGEDVAASEFMTDGRSDTFGNRFTLATTGRAATSGFVLTAPARAGRTWFPTGGELVAAYQVELLAGRESETDSDAYQWVMAADDGRVLRRQNLTESDAFTYRVWADDAPPYTPFDGPHADFTPHPTGTPDGTDPTLIPVPNLVTIEGFNSNPFGSADPWLPSSAAETVGNNVDAYTDDNAPDGYSNADLRATLTGPQTFDRSFDLLAHPLASEDQSMAAVTQLFYINNWLHDLWYDSGFDEAAGNAQEYNYGRGGMGGDPLRAEAQDSALAGARNNANMSTPADGISPRMQIYLWSGAVETSLTVSPLPEPLVTGTAAFGPTDFSASGQVVLVNDGTGAVNDGCEALVNDVAGSIALVDRGSCTFVLKALNAQNAGAIGMILANNVAGAPPGMGGTSPVPITIGSLSVSQSDGNAIKAALQSGPVTASMSRISGLDRDGDLDSTLVSHEWGHYLHNRLIAGCGTIQCRSQGEGWGDFLSLHTMLRPGDDLAGAFPVAQFSRREVTDSYFGLRRFPYSVNTSMNDLSFRHISDGEVLPTTPINANAQPNSEVHNAGEIWASMMFEAYVELLDAHPFDDARRRMADVVVTGLQLAPADPTFTEQRDALLAAAFAADPLDADRMAAAFARRGAGACAVSPPRNSADLVGVIEDFGVAGGWTQVEILSLDDSLASCDDDGYLDSGETGELRVRVHNQGLAILSGLTLELSSTDPALSFPDGASVPLPELTSFAAIDIAVRAQWSPSAVKDLSYPGVTASLDDAQLCAAASASAFFQVDRDMVPSSVETVELEQPPWQETGTTPGVWNRAGDELTPANHVWLGSDSSFLSDASLVTPALELSTDTSFVVSFSHRHSFEADTVTPIYWDGGVIELSTDGGASWADVGNFGVAPGYGGALTDLSSNPLALRDAFVASNGSWPNREPVTLDFGTALAGETVLLRFRIGTDVAVGSFGWEIDDLAVTGIVNLPFIELGPDATVDCTASSDIFSDGFELGNTSVWSASAP